MSLTKVQEEIVKAPLGAMLVTAGAGSGKTRVLTHRVAHLIDEMGIPEGAIVALTFTNKAANEMRERIQKLRGTSEHSHAFFGTFHSFCAGLLRRYIKNLPPFDSNFSIYGTSDTQKTIKEITGDKDVAKQIEYHISKMKNAAMTPDEYENEILEMRDCDYIIKTIKDYNQTLMARNALDFDDLLLKVLELFSKRPDILEELQARYQYILVDEFQDTNTPQYLIAQQLAWKHKNLMAVGDEDQCIYTWRGASSKNLKLLMSDFPDTKIYKLEQNFRSCKNIVDLASGLVCNNKARIDKKLFSEIPDGVVLHNKYYSDTEEAQKVVEKIDYYVDNGLATYSDFAILIRINALSRLFEKEFRERRIPHVIWGGFKFYERAEVKALLYYLRLIANPNDDVAFTESVNFPRRGVGNATIDKIIASAKEQGVNCQTAATKIENKGLRAFKQVMKTLREAYENDGLEGLAANLIPATGLEKHYNELKNEDGTSRIKNMYGLVADMQTLVNKNKDATLQDFIEQVALISNSADEEGDDKVIISTIHSAKGLEFKHVFIVGMEEGIFPLSRAEASPSEMEEERRLLYVAITRAMYGLDVSNVMTRNYYGKYTYMNPSRFLMELGFFD